MLVYAGFECWYRGGNEVRQLQKMFSTELDALRWAEALPANEFEWRFYQPIELE